MPRFAVCAFALGLLALAGETRVFAAEPAFDGPLCRELLMGSDPTSELRLPENLHTEKGRACIRGAVDDDDSCGPEEPGAPSRQESPPQRSSNGGDLARRASLAPPDSTLHAFAPPSRGDARPGFARRIDRPPRV